MFCLLLCLLTFNTNILKNPNGLLYIYFVTIFNVLNLKYYSNKKVCLKTEVLILKNTAMSLVLLNLGNIL